MPVLLDAVGVPRKNTDNTPRFYLCGDLCNEPQDYLSPSRLHRQQPEAATRKSLLSRICQAPAVIPGRPEEILAIKPHSIAACSEHQLGPQKTEEGVRVEKPRMMRRDPLDWLASDV